MWPPELPANATWRDVALLQLRPWRERGISVSEYLRQTNGMQRWPAAMPAPAVAIVDTDDLRVARPRGPPPWKPHHSIRAAATLNLFRLAQQRASRAGRPLPRIRFVLVLSDGHGSTASGFNGSACTCTSEARCCDPAVDAPPTDAPAAPAFATLHCRHAYDVSVPTIIEDLLPDTRTPASIEASLRKWIALGDATPWDARARRAFFVGDGKGYRPTAVRLGRAHPELLSAHHAVSTDPASRVPFAEHAKYKAAVYAHGFHFNSVRWRRLALLGGAVIAQEAPCKEWWQLLATPWVHYAPTRETFADLVGVSSRLLAPENDAQARQIAQRSRELALSAFRPRGLLDYIEALWIEYATLQQLHADSRAAGADSRAAGAEASSDRSSKSPDADASSDGAPGRMMDRGAASRAAREPRPLLLPQRLPRPSAHATAKGWERTEVVPDAPECTTWPGEAVLGSDEARCLHGNRRRDGYVYYHNRWRGTPAATCGRAARCACCRARAKEG